MSAIPPSSQSISTGGAQCVPPASALEIDGSCRVPVLLLLISAVVWLFISSVLAIVASLKFHQPNILADCAWFTYGRVHPAHLTALIYGFGMQAGLGVSLWMIAHLGRVRLAGMPTILAGTILWNLGMTMGILGILYGESTGYEWLEMPRYASLTLFAGYILIAVSGLVTLHLRVERRFYISQWFILAAFFWFPWIYTTAGLLLTQQPVRGTLQAAIDFWYINNLKNIWFGFIGLAVIFYFVPKIVQRALYSEYIGIFIFWTLAFFGSSGGIPPGTPLPSWMSALSTAATALTVVPAIAVAINVRGTMHGDCSKMGEERTLKFFVFSMFFYVIATLSVALNSTIRFGKITGLTWYAPAQTQLFLYGFFALTIFGAIYYIIPRLTLAKFPSCKLICGHFFLAVIGILLYSVPLAIGGFKQGIATYDSSLDFSQIVAGTLPFLRASTTGDLLMALGHLVMLLNIFGLLASVGRKVGMVAWTEGTKVEALS